jgi:hypothetical protein
VLLLVDGLVETASLRAVGTPFQETRSFFTTVSQLEHFNWLVVYG